MLSASYDPADDKLRLRSVARLDSETYTRVKAAGFGWAPKQGCFFAVWRPDREDLALELAGEIGDEDTSLVERAEERAERFEEYSGKRENEAHRAHDAVAAIADNIPLGQPILVGHHSERRARKDAERIRNGMAKAVKLWDTSVYWTRRAAGALHHAKYKELPAVRHRRIKGLEADMRREVKHRSAALALVKAWSAEGLTPERARAIANFDGGTGIRAWSRLDDALTGRSDQAPADVMAAVVPESIAAHTRTVEHCERWISHITNRLAYERAMLGESGGIAAEKFPIEVGGRVLIHGKWMVVTRLNKTDGKLASVGVIGHWAKSASIELVTDYRAPEPGDAEKVAKASKLPPLVNYDAEGFHRCTSADWKRWQAAQVGHAKRIDATPEHGAHRARVAYYQGRYAGVFLTDAKVVERPMATVRTTDVVQARAELAPETDVPTLLETHDRRAAARERGAAREAEAAPFEALRQSVRAGVAVVSAPQLFPTPPALAARMADLAGIKDGDRVLEPSAGTGRLVRQLRERGARVTAVEIDGRLAERLRNDASGALVRCADFLRIAPEDLGGVEAVVMNPPFANAQDITHVKHAFTFVRPGGRLVALCANGPRQREELLPWVQTLGGTWEDLPEGTFASEGTWVRVALLVVDKGAQ